MTEAEHAKLQALREMMETTGWDTFVAEHKEQAVAMRANAVDTAKNMEQLCYLKGFIAALEGICNFATHLDAIEEASKQADAQNPV